MYQYVAVLEPKLDKLQKKSQPKTTTMIRQLLRRVRARHHPTTTPRALGGSPHVSSDHHHDTDTTSLFTLLQSFFAPSTSSPSSQPPLTWALAGASAPFPLDATSTDNANAAERSGLIQDILGEYLWMAVPKQRITRSKRRIKNYRKRIVADVKHVQVCELCGETKLRHVLCECVVKDTSWKAHRDDNSWLNAGNMREEDLGSEYAQEMEEEIKQ